MWDAFRSLFRPDPRPPRVHDYDVTGGAGRVVLTIRPGGRRYAMTALEARKLSASLAMAAGRADGRDD